MEADWLSHADENDPSTWPTKADLRTRLGISNKTIERWAAKPDKLRTQQRKPPGHKSIPVYHPGDVRVLWGQTMPVQQNDTTPATVEQRHVTTRQATSPAVVAETLRSIPAFLESEQGGILRDALVSLSRLSQPEKPLVGLEKGAKIASISSKELKELAEKGVIPAAKKGRRWIFCRADLLAINIKQVSHLSGVTLMTPTQNDTAQGDRWRNGDDARH